MLAFRSAWPQIRGMAGLVPVAIAHNYPEAMLLAGKLEAYGVEAYPLGAPLVAMDPMTSLAIGGIRVCVAAEDVALARELIGEHVEGEPEADLPEPHAPSWSDRLLYVILFGMFGVVAPPKVRPDKP